MLNTYKKGSKQQKVIGYDSRFQFNAYFAQKTMIKDHSVVSLDKSINIVIVNKYA